jgi:hypothetical protein
MNILTDKKESTATDVWFANEMLYVRLTDGREIGSPLAWFPRLQKATESQRKNWRFIGSGMGIHWEDVDEDILVEALL